jgi:2-methylisocitrate lyase-like PEP mutase family enzyme
MDQRAKADELRRLHAGAAPLVLPNVWDAVSARTVAAQPGCRAVATASWSVAAALGRPDGEMLGREEMLAAVARVASAVEVPVTADLETGYGGSAAAVCATIADAIAAGAVGCNLEDGVPGGLRPADEAAERVAAAVAAGRAAGVPVVVNARTDVYLRPPGARPGDAFATAGARGRAYREAGADCVFVPGAADAGLIGALVREIGPVSVLAGPASPPLAELARLGVRRVSFGPGTLGVAMAALRDAAARLLAGEGPYPPELAFRPPGRA